MGQKNVYIKGVELWVPGAGPCELATELGQFLAPSRVGPSAPTSTLTMRQLIPASRSHGKGDGTAAFLGKSLSKGDQMYTCAQGYPAAWSCCVSRNKEPGMAPCTEHRSGQSKQGFASDRGCLLLHEHPEGCSDSHAVLSLCSALLTWLYLGTILGAFCKYNQEKPRHVCQSQILPTWEQLLHSWDDKTCFQSPKSLGWLSLCGRRCAGKQAWGYSVTAVIWAPSRHFQWKNLI